ncbi:MAG: hypothetical protein ACOVOV_07350, partial [Dolichospermum sp.]
AARFYDPTGIAVDGAGYVYVGDWTNNAIRKIVPDCIAPSVPTITGNVTFCLGGSSVLTSSALNGNLWSTGDTTRSITVSTAGSYSVRNVRNNCTSASSISANVIVNGITPVVTSSRSTSICSGSSVILTSSIPTGNFWNNGATTQSITVNAAGSYTVVNVQGNCTSRASTPIVVQVSPIPATPSITASGPTTFCTGGSVTLSAPSGFGYIWSNGETSQSITTNIAGNYTVRVIQNGCTSIASAPTSITITGTTPTITAVGSTTFTIGGSVTLVASPSPAYLWSTGATTQSIVVRTDGSYTVRSIGNGCTSAASVPVVVSTINNFEVSTLAGSGGASFADGNGTSASFNFPLGIVSNPIGNVYVADNANNRIRRITPSGVVTTIAGSGNIGSTNGLATTATFNGPSDLAVDAIGNLYISD